MVGLYLEEQLVSSRTCERKEALLKLTVEKDHSRVRGGRHLAVPSSCELPENIEANSGL